MPRGTSTAIELDMPLGAEYRIYHSLELEPLEEEWSDPTQCGLMATSLPVPNVGFTSLTGTYTGNAQDLPTLTPGASAPSSFYLVVGIQDGAEVVVIGEPVRVTVP